MPRRHRVVLDLPADLVAQAVAAARTRGDQLSVVVHAAVITAVKAAEAGRGELLPERLPRRTPGAAPPAATAPVAYTASREQAARCAAALDGAGSSVRQVAVRSLEAYVAADGVWLDAPMPGEPGVVWRVSGAA